MDKSITYIYLKTSDKELKRKKDAIKITKHILRVEELLEI